MSWWDSDAGDVLGDEPADALTGALRRAAGERRALRSAPPTLKELLDATASALGARRDPVGAVAFDETARQVVRFDVGAHAQIEREPGQRDGAEGEVAARVARAVVVEPVALVTNDRFYQRGLEAVLRPAQQLEQ